MNTKAKLIKSDVQYRLHNEEGIVIATSFENGKLSKQNCDEIFGVIDVESLALAKASHFGGTYRNPEGFSDEQIGYLHGFIEAMELNDKLFTEDDLRLAIEMARKGSMQEQHNGYGQRTSPIFVSDNLSVDTIIQSLQQPKEIEVEVVMSEIVTDDFVGMQGIPKLDTNGCLILRRINC
jgi:hypothetical protein